MPNESSAFSSNAAMLKNTGNVENLFINLGSRYICEVQSACQAYTALFDVGRENVDGRSIAEYKVWLSKTCKLFPDIIVFHDGCLDSIENSDGHFVRLDLGSLRTFSLLPKLSAVLETFTPKAAADITFRLPEYGLVQLAKFELAEKVFEMTNTDSVLWVDAGISRFVPVPLNVNNIQDFSRFLLKSHFDYFFEIDTRRNWNPLKMKLNRPGVGTSRRIVAGGSFWVRSRNIDALSTSIFNYAKSWVEAGIWDNEQILLRYLLPDIPGGKLYVRKGSALTAIVPRIMMENTWRPSKVKNRWFNILMR
jgi:hypothetical protein